METYSDTNTTCNPASIPVATPTGATFDESASASNPALVRVLHVINGEYYAGAERVQDLLALRLPEFGFQAGFACVKLDLFDEMREARTAPLYNLPMWSRFDMRVAYKVAEIVEKEKYQIIHGHTVRTAMVGAFAAKLAGVPMIYHAHSPTSHDTTHRWRDRFNGIAERLSLHDVSRIIAVSRALADRMIEAGFDPKRVTVVHNGVPSPKSPPKIEKREVPAGTWTLGVIALFRPRKGIETLLDALARLRQQGIPVHLRAVGSFESVEYEAEIAHRVRQLGLFEHVSWTGFTRDTVNELHKMDLFVLPSLFGEGLPMVILEAMASGVPVVSTRVAGIPEAIRDGQDGLLVEPGNAVELADAIASIIRGEVAWPTLRANALARHAQYFSDRSMAAGVAQVYREVLAEKSRSL
jgi:glycosyltransferase involved in cell wall biosynthesis